MIVMNAGRIEQIGTPEQVYGQPASTFVAGFIGSPPMNLMACTTDGLNATLGAHTLPLPARAPRSGALTLGVRPEHAAMDPQGAWSMAVEMLEMLGAERLVYGRLGDAAFTLRIEATLAPPRPGDTLRLNVQPQHLHWFDVATGLRVDA
jgi:sn-glycerol 3-phosphate transport system ATP-binding protein